MKKAKTESKQAVIEAGSLKIEYRSLDSLIPYARNPRTHSEEQIVQIAALWCVQNLYLKPQIHRKIAPSLINRQGRRSEVYISCPYRKFMGSCLGEFITGRQLMLPILRRDDSKAKGLPTSNLYHVISNVRITFPKPGEALHQSYWQTVHRGTDGKMAAAAMGRSEDRLVKRNGKWLIQSRKLTVFTD